MRAKLFTVFIILILFFTSCKENHISFLSKTERLTRRVWSISSMIDNETNQSLSFSETTYEFLDDGILIIESLNQNIIDTSEWKFMYGDDYLKIGSNTYKITSLTQRLMSLKYGAIDIYYEPYE